MSGLLVSCPRHDALLTMAEDGTWACPEPECQVAVRVTARDSIPSPMTPLAQQAAGHSELVLTYQQQGLSRSEAMQVLCAVISAGIMKDRGPSG